jgi:hypothetical protein
MFGRGVLFVAVIAAAIFVPYFLSEQPATIDGYAQASPLRQWWDSMWTDSIDGPVPSASPIPNRRFGNGNVPPLQRSYSPTGNRTLAGRYVPQAPMSTHVGMAGPANNPGVPMATPWVPVGPPGQTAPSGSMPSQTAMGTAAGPWTPVNPQAAYGAAGSLGVGSPSLDLSQLVSFDVTPDWVMQNWDRVSTQIWDGQWEGMRVPLISGTSARDLAGSLTYYFDREQTLQRVAFQGSTGSLERIQQLGMQLGLQPRPSFGGTTLIRETEEGLLTDLMRMSPLSGRAASQFRRYDVKFELNRPGNGRGLSEALANTLHAASSLPSLDTRPLEDALRGQRNAGLLQRHGFPQSPGLPPLEPSGNLPPN